MLQGQLLVVRSLWEKINYQEKYSEYKYLQQLRSGGMH